MKKILAVLLAAATMSMSFVGCNSTPAESSKAPAESKTPVSSVASKEEEKEDESKYDVNMKADLSLSGSSALLPLVKLAIDPFNEIYADVNIEANGGGSGTGRQQVFDGTVDIGNSDVDCSEEQAEKLKGYKVCTITMAAVANPKAGVEDLTKAQLLDIFTGKVTNWKEVGGNDLEIALITRPEGSGTKALFQQYGLDGTEEITSTLNMDNSGELLQNVRDNDGAIGYVALSYLTDNDTQDVPVVPVKIDGVEPTNENTYNGTYPIWGYEYMFTNGEGTDAARAFIDFMMSEDFASVIEEAGYGASYKLTDTAKEGR